MKNVMNEPPDPCLYLNIVCFSLWLSSLMLKNLKDRDKGKIPAAYIIVSALDRQNVLAG